MHFGGDRSKTRIYEFSSNNKIINNYTKITADGDCSHEIKRLLLLGSYDQPRQHIKKHTKGNIRGIKITKQLKLADCKPYGNSQPQSSADACSFMENNAGI